MSLNRTVASTRSDSGIASSSPSMKPSIAASAGCQSLEMSTWSSPGSSMACASGMRSAKYGAAIADPVRHSTAVGTWTLGRIASMFVGRDELPLGSRVRGRATDPRVFADPINERLVAISTWRDRRDDFAGQGISAPSLLDRVGVLEDRRLRRCGRSAPMSVTTARARRSVRGTWRRTRCTMQLRARAPRAPTRSEPTASSTARMSSNRCSSVGGAS